MNNDLEQFEYAEEMAEQRRNRIIRIVCIAVSVLIAVGIYVTYLVVRSEAKREAAALSAIANKYESMLSPLISERNALENEIKSVTDKRDGLGLDMATILYVFAEPSSRIIGDGAFAQLDSYGYSAIVAVSDALFPGNDGCLTIDDMRMLIGHGWEIAVSADGSTDIGAVCARLADAGLPAPVAVYYPFGGYDDSAADAIRDAGISAVIRYVSETEQNGESALWMPTAIGSYENNVKKYYESAVAHSECVVLVTGFINSREMYYESNFRAMLSLSDQTISSGSAVNLQFGQAHDRFRLVQTMKTDNEKQCNAQLELMNANLENLKNEIDELNARRVAEIREARGEK